MNIDKLIKGYERKIKTLSIHAFRNRGEIKRLKANVQFLEGSRDILSTMITNASSNSEEEVRGNNFANYASQINALYDMYNGLAKYGSHTVRGIINIRVAFIGGEGMSVVSDNPATQDYINRFLQANKLNGSLLINLIKTGELEGKCLMVLEPETSDEYIRVRFVTHYINPYTVNVSSDDPNEIESVTYKPDKQSEKEEEIETYKCVYVKLGGSPDKVNDTYTKTGTCLTQIQNYDRALYDLRANNHLFAKITPYWKTATQSDAQIINNAVNNKEWTIGQGYAGNADFSLVSPPTTALECINGEMLLNMKIIATVTGIPIHWMAWTEMLSNRATAENLLEVINAHTKEERLIWIESFTDLIDRARNMAVDKGWESNEILEGSIQVKLPTATLSALTAIQNTWIPLKQAGVISMTTLRNRIPEINPIEEEELIRIEVEKGKPILKVKNDLTTPGSEEIKVQAWNKYAGKNRKF